MLRHARKHLKKPLSRGGGISLGIAAITAVTLFSGNGLTSSFDFSSKNSTQPTTPSGRLPSAPSAVSCKPLEIKEASESNLSLFTSPDVTVAEMEIRNPNTNEGCAFEISQLIAHVSTYPPSARSGSYWDFDQRQMRLYRELYKTAVSPVLLDTSNAVQIENMGYGGIGFSWDKPYLLGPGKKEHFSITMDLRDATVRGVINPEAGDAIALTFTNELNEDGWKTSGGLPVSKLFATEYQSVVLYE